MEKSIQQLQKALLKCDYFSQKQKLFQTDELLNVFSEQVLENLAIFQMNGSGGTFHSLVGLEIHTARYKPLKGGSYVPLPKFLTAKSFDKHEKLGKTKQHSML